MQNKILVIGDSHVRAFSFNAHFIPLFIGPAAFNNFLSDNNADKLYTKVSDLLSSDAQHSWKVMFLFSGDVIHISRKSKGICSEEETAIEEAANRYKAFIEKITKEFTSINFVVGAALVGDTKNYIHYLNMYNTILSKYCDDSKIDFIDISQNISDKAGFLAYPYKADFAHISYRAIKFYVDNLLKLGILFKEPHSYVQDYSWQYTYNMVTKSGPYKIYGKIYKDQLIVDNRQTLQLQSLEKESQLFSKLITEIANVSIDYLGSDGVTIGNGGEGFLGIEILKKHKVHVNGFDFDSQKIANFQILKSLFKINMELSLENLDNIKLQFYETVVDFEQYKFSEENRQKLLKCYYDKSSFIFLLSTNLKSDERILKKVGYRMIVLYRLVESSNNTIVLVSKNDLKLSLRKKIEDRFSHHSLSNTKTNFLFKELFNRVALKLKNSYKR